MQRRRSILAWMIAAACAGTYAMTHAAVRAASVPPPALESIPFAIEDWAGGPAPPLAPDVARVLAADAYLHRYYQNSAGIVEIDVAYYGQRRVGASMHSPLNCLPGNGWLITDSRTLRVETPWGPADVTELTVKRNKSVFAIAYWYQNRDRILTGEAATRVRLLADSLKGLPSDVGLVRVMTPLTGRQATDRAAVGDFATLLIPQLADTWR